MVSCWPVPGEDDSGFTMLKLTVLTISPLYYLQVSPLSGLIEGSAVVPVCATWRTRPFAFIYYISCFSKLGYSIC